MLAADSMDSDGVFAFIDLRYAAFSSSPQILCNFARFPRQGMYVGLFFGTRLPCGTTWIASCCTSTKVCVRSCVCCCAHVESQLICTISRQFEARRAFQRAGNGSYGKRVIAAMLYLHFSAWDMCNVGTVCKFVLETCRSTLVFAWYVCYSRVSCLVSLSLSSLFAFCSSLFMS